MQRTKGMIMVTAAPMLWGCSGIFVEYLFNHGVTSSWLVDIRLLITGMAILSYSFFTTGRAVFAVWHDRKQIFHLLFFSIFGMLAIQLTYFMTISYSDPSMATILQFTNAVLLSVFVALKLKTWPKRVEVISLVMAVAGVVLLVTNGHLTQLNISLPGLIWGLLSAVAAVSYTILPTRLVARFGALPIVGWGMLLSGILFNFYQPCWTAVPQFDLPIILCILFIIIFGTIFPFVLFVQGLQWVKPTTASLLGAIEPLSAAVLSILFLAIHLSLPKLIGMALILGTVFIQALDKPRMPKRRRPAALHKQ